MKRRLHLFVFLIAIAVTFNANAQVNPCPLLTHNSFTNFNASSNPGTATTLWLNLHTKLTSSQLTNSGDYILFSGGNLSFQGINTSFGSSASLPKGKIIAASSVSEPSVSFESATNTWITLVPLGFSSSDIFIAGAAISSETGFSLEGGSKSTTLTGNFYSNKSIASSWFYGLACYQPVFSNNTCGTVNGVSGIPVGGRKAGTPDDQMNGLVAGGTGGGGSNFTGSYSSTDHFTACPPPDDGPPEKRDDGSGNGNEVIINKTGSLQVIPNPFTYNGTISYNLASAGIVILKIYSIAGVEIATLANEEQVPGKHQVNWNAEGIPGGVYLVRLNAGSHQEISKMIITK